MSENMSLSEDMVAAYAKEYNMDFKEAEQVLLMLKQDGTQALISDNPNALGNYARRMREEWALPDQADATRMWKLND